MQEYTNTDQQLHLLSQLVAKANRTFVPKKEDDSHTNLCFDNLGNRISGRWIETKDSQLLFTLNIDTQTIVVVNEASKLMAGVSTISKHMEEVEQEIEKVLPDLGLAPDGFSEPLHYEIPSYDFAKKPIVKIDSNGLSQWKHVRQLANQACYELMGYVQMWDDVRIWPHHFDTGIYIIPTKKLGIGFGLAMEDSMAGSPYFYLAGYPLQGEIIYKNLPHSDKWEWKIGENWKGAILKLDTLQKQNETEQLKCVGKFIVENTKWFLADEN